MKSRLQDIPIYEQRNTSVSAEHYNLFKIALKRLGPQIHFQLPRLRSLDLLLDEETWIVIDRRLNDIPVMAWLDFDAQERALHEPVNCQLNLYHAHAGILIEKVMEAMALILGEKLADQTPHNSAGVTPITRGAQRNPD